MKNKGEILFYFSIFLAVFVFYDIMGKYYLHRMGLLKKIALIFNPDMIVFGYSLGIYSVQIIPVTLLCFCLEHFRKKDFCMYHKKTRTILFLTLLWQMIVLVISLVNRGVF